MNELASCSLIGGLPFYVLGLISGLFAGLWAGYIQGHQDRHRGVSKLRGLNTSHIR